MEKADKSLIVQYEGDGAWLLDTALFEQTQRAAQMLMKTDMAPKHYQKNLANCAIAIHQALRMGLEPMEFMQQTYVIGGKVGLNSKLCIALANKSGIFKDVIQFKFSGKGDGLTCAATAFTAATGVKCEAACSVQDAKDMGWWNRNGSPWPKQTRKMLQYRSATRLIDSYCPEVLMGLGSAEALRDRKQEILAEERDITSEVNEELESFKENMDKPEFQPKKKSAKAFGQSKDKPEPEKKPDDSTKIELHPNTLALKEAWGDDLYKADFEQLIASGETDHHEITSAIGSNRAETAKQITDKLDALVGRG